MSGRLLILAILALILGTASAALAQTAPSFDSSTYTREIAENAGAEEDAGGRDVGGAVSATGGVGTVTYTLGGTDAASFEIDSTTGQISTKAGVNYDHEAKSSYTVTVTATDTNSATADATVTISITDEEEPPLVPCTR